MPKTVIKSGTIGEQVEAAGVSRRDFLAFCTKLMAAAPVGLALTEYFDIEAFAADLAQVRRPSVIWLHFQDCTGCSETLLRPSQPDVADLIFNVISLDYHETLMAASGHQAEAAREEAMRLNEGKFICVVEGSIPVAEDGIYCTVGGKKATDILQEVGSRAAAVVAIGSCASWGGVPSAGPNPTGASGVDRLFDGKPVINIPGCPPNPYVLLGTILEYASAGRLPALDEKKRPKFAYDRVIHDHCPRRGHFDNGRFVERFDDDGHREGWCLYKVGCKGPDTHAPCSTRHFNEVVDAWPIGIGHPCFGCTEQELGFKVPLFQPIPIHNATPPSTYPPIHTGQGTLDALAVGGTGAAIGLLAGASYMAARRFSDKPGDNSVPGKGGSDPADGDES